MSIMVLFLAVIAAIAGWWLSHQRLAAEPSLEIGLRADFPRTQASRLPPGKIGLGLFLVVAGCLFSLLTSAYLMRGEAVVPELAGAALLPQRLLWVNTAALAASSIALHFACVAARGGQRGVVLANVLAATIAALAFVAGQLLAWRMLVQAGHPIASSQTDAFFYVLTGVHGLHVLGGLVALGRTVARLLGDASLPRLRLAVELCALYWHFLLLVWLVLFGLLIGGADAIASLCRAFVT